MNLHQPQIKRAANIQVYGDMAAAVNRRQAASERIGTIPVAEYNDDYEPIAPGYIKNRHRPAEAPVVGIDGTFVNPVMDYGLDDLYNSSEKAALSKATNQRAASGDTLAFQQMGGAAPPPGVIQSAGRTFQPSDGQRPSVGAPPQFPPQPMSPEELDSYNRRARKAATHPRLIRADVCLNCEFFLAYTRGTDKRHFTLCKWDGASPWDKNFTCGTSKCGNYLEYGSEPAAASVDQPAAKPKRKRRSRAEIEAAEPQKPAPVKESAALFMKTPYAAADAEPSDELGEALAKLDAFVESGDRR